MYTCIIFDVDGTIINTEKAVIGSLQKTLKEVLGREYGREELTFVLGVPGTTSLPKLGIQNIAEVNDRWNENMKDFYADIHIYPEIDQVLRTLKERNVMTGIVTSKTRQELQDDFVPFGLMKYLPFIVTADDTLKHKPNPEPIQKFLEISGANQSEAIYIGDTIYDMRCASDARVDFALAVWGAAQSPNGIDAKYKLNEPLDILELL
ncbi:HAD family hydrolase [Paenibacillus segetis]|uniref:Hydrolase n=1 Tax=Paenibacillus segetis TaxID=1325360 RepID=A0ABQ1Y1D0_9BACL|nr:HAD family hydrolase [Paenibacillus segetis]GGH09412.1 hydrolase [Paenibacillus segetis]